MKRGPVLLVILGLSVAANLWLLYALIDRASATSDMQQQVAVDAGTIGDFQWITRTYGRFPARGAIEREIRDGFAGPDDVVKWDGDTLWVNEIGFVCDRDSVRNVVLLNEVN